MTEEATCAIEKPLPVRWEDRLQEAILTGEFDATAKSDSFMWQTCACGQHSPLIPRDSNGMPRDPYLQALGAAFCRLVGVDGATAEGSLSHGVGVELPLDVVRLLDRDDYELKHEVSVEERALAAWVVMEFIEERAAEVQRDTILKLPRADRLTYCLEQGMSLDEAKGWLEYCIKE